MLSLRVLVDVLVFFRGFHRGWEANSHVCKHKVILAPGVKMLRCQEIAPRMNPERPAFTPARPPALAPAPLQVPQMFSTSPSTSQALNMFKTSTETETPGKLSATLFS